MPPRKSSASTQITVRATGDAQRIADGEVCSVHGFGTSGKLSYERRDLLAEDFSSSKQFLSSHPLLSGTGRRPDVLVLQMGYQTCTISHYKEYAKAENWSQLLEKNADELLKSLQKLLQQMRDKGEAAPKVIVSIPGRLFSNETLLGSKYSRADFDGDLDNIDYCIWRLGGVLTYIAHLHGFPVLAREEIEHRLLLKTEHFYGTVDPEALASNGAIAVEHVHHLTRGSLAKVVAFPGAPIVAAALAEMLYCMDRNQTFAMI